MNLYLNVFFCFRRKAAISHTTKKIQVSVYDGKMLQQSLITFLFSYLFIFNFSVNMYLLVTMVHWKVLQ